MRFALLSSSRSSDSGTTAHSDVAIDQAYRAVSDLFRKGQTGRLAYAIMSMRAPATSGRGDSRRSRVSLL